MIHELKTHPIFFAAVKCGNKSFEVRKNNQDFKTYDYLRLREWRKGKYTGDECLVKIVYILDETEWSRWIRPLSAQFPMKKGYAVFGIRHAINQFLSCES